MTQRDHWFEELADHLGDAYLRYSFTKGTEQEVGFLVETLGLAAGDRVLDVGCGPGRHAYALGRRGIEVVGLDVSARFVELANDGAPDGVTFQRGDARALSFDGEFDAAVSLCQGALGLGGPAGALAADRAVLAGMARALRPGGRLAASAFSSYFQVRFLEDTDAFDAASGVNHERSTLRSEEGVDADHDLWTTCFTPRELTLLAEEVGLTVRAIWSVSPGAYAARPPDLDSHEFLLVADKAVEAPS